MQDPSTQPTLDRITVIIILLGVVIGQLLATKICWNAGRLRIPSGYRVTVTLAGSSS